MGASPGHIKSRECFFQSRGYVFQLLGYKKTQITDI
jgi:hypothetical protein